MFLTEFPEGNLDNCLLELPENMFSMLFQGYMIFGNIPEGNLDKCLLELLALLLFCHCYALALPLLCPCSRRGLGGPVTEPDCTDGVAERQPGSQAASR
jgi:hypothetical protein